MNYSETYKKILSEIAQGHRGYIRLKEDQLEELNNQLVFCLEDHQKLEEILCIIEHSATLYLKYEKNLIHLLNRSLPDHIVIFTLNCARKHIVEARFQKGQRLEFEFLETLKKLLYHPSPEVVEWVLRLIEGCGPQGIYFSQDFDKIKPPPWKWFNAHSRAVREIITLLERRWSKFEKR